GGGGRRDRHEQPADGHGVYWAPAAKTVRRYATASASPVTATSSSPARFHSHSSSVGGSAVTPASAPSRSLTRTCTSSGVARTSQLPPVVSSRTLRPSAVPRVSPYSSGQVR